ncbi:hypothetical protein V6N11_078060 [Hibiscus sabdariffa]|uniref:Uncharacterized protein n=1 Tax=Hibiscus sabdariffa TaxID=183260 RepID=A0ABR2TFT9_9ROSI
MSPSMSISSRSTIPQLQLLEYLIISSQVSVEPLGPASDAIACDDALPVNQHDEPTCEPVAAQHDDTHNEHDAQHVDCDPLTHTDTHNEHDAERDGSEHDDTHNEHDAQHVDCDPVTHADTHSDDVLPECDADHDDSNPITHTGALPASSNQHSMRIRSGHKQLWLNLMLFRPMELGI